MVEYGRGDDVCASPFECALINRRERSPMKAS